MKTFYVLLLLVLAASVSASPVAILERIAAHNEPVFQNFPSKTHCPKSKHRPNPHLICICIGLTLSPKTADGTDKAVSFTQVELEADAKDWFGFHKGQKGKGAYPKNYSWNPNNPENAKIPERCQALATKDGKLGRGLPMWELPIGENGATWKSMGSTQGQYRVGSLL
jgi:hypothetical protein